MILSYKILKAKLTYKLFYKEKNTFSELALN